MPQLAGMQPAASAPTAGLQPGGMELTSSQQAALQVAQMQKSMTQQVEMNGAAMQQAPQQQSAMQQVAMQQAAMTQAILQQAAYQQASMQPAMMPAQQAGMPLMDQMPQQSALQSMMQPTGMQSTPQQTGVPSALMEQMPAQSTMTPQAGMQQDASFQQQMAAMQQAVMQQAAMQQAAIQQAAMQQMAMLQRQAMQQAAMQQAKMQQPTMQQQAMQQTAVEQANQPPTMQQAALDPAGQLQAMQAAVEQANQPQGTQQQQMLGQRLVVGWPPLDQPNGRKIASLEESPSMMRHDMLVETRVVGKLIGLGGCTYKELTNKSGCNIFILDREGPPPGCDDAHRLIVLMGYVTQVATAKEELETLLATCQMSTNRLQELLGLEANPGQAPTGEEVKLLAEAETLVSKLGAETACAFPGLGLQMGRKIAQLLTTKEHIRKDLIVPKAMVGRILGSGGSKFKEIMSNTSCKVFVLDKEGPPPGYEDDQRMVTLIGFESQVQAAENEIESLIQSALRRPQFTLGRPSSYPQPYVDLSYKDHDDEPSSSRGVKRPYE